MNVKNLVLGIGIVVVFALMMWQGIEAFYPSPKYESFCAGSAYGYRGPYYPEKVGFEQNCTNPIGLRELETQCSDKGGFAVYDYDKNDCIVGFKECNICNKKFEEARDNYSKKLFVIALIIGILTIIIGYSVISIEPAGSALIGAGIWAIFYGSAWNWRNFSNIWRFLLLLIALVVIIWIAIKLNVKGGENKGRDKSRISKLSKLIKEDDEGKDKPWWKI